MSRTRETTAPQPPAEPAVLLITKLHPPPEREHNVARARLVERLRQTSGVKLTLVAAPAGSGKTTLLATWREAEATARPVAWLTLDDGDNDPSVLWSHVLGALRRACPGFGASLPAMVRAHTLDVVLRQLVNDLAEQGEIALILDDFHRLSRGPARDSIAWLVDHAPAMFNLVIASRSEPGLPLAPMRAHAELLEVRADELGFTASEADTLLNERLDLGLSRPDVEHLVERIEGWPAGIYLAGLSLRGVQDRHSFVETFGGTSTHVVDFLVDEVLDAHDPEMQSLMLRSSILDRLSGPLCDAVLEQQGSGALLAALSRTNLFLVPLDSQGEWYRFHHLFAQLLRVELEDREPGLAEVLHRRAYAWHRAHGSTDEAIKHALQAGAFAEASDAIAEAWLWTASAGRHETVLSWLEAFPPQLVDEDPQLLLMKAWMCSQAGARDEAAAAITAVERLGWRDARPLPDGSTSLEASLATIRAGYPWGDVGAAYENALRAIDLQRRDSPMWSAASWALAMACYYRGDLGEADRWFRETTLVGIANHRWLVAVSGLAYRSLIAGERGDIDEQRRFAEEGAELARQRGIDEVRGEVHVALGVSLQARGRLEEALTSLERGVGVLRRSQPLDFAMALIRSAAASRVAGNRDAAIAALDEAATTLRACRDPGVLQAQLDVLSRPARAAGPRDAELSERERVVLRMLTGTLSEREIGRELYLSHNTIHSHTRSIYRKLGVSSRRQAVRRAIELGIL